MPGRYTLYVSERDKAAQEAKEAQTHGVKPH